MEAPPSHLDETVQIGGHGAYRDQGVHRGSSVPEAYQGPPEDRIPAVENNGCGEEQDWKREKVNRHRWEVLEETCIQNHGYYHDIGTQKGRDPETEKFLPVLTGYFGEIIRKRRLVTQTADLLEDLDGGHYVGKVFETGVVPKKKGFFRESCGKNVLLPLLFTSANPPVSG